MHKCTTHMRAHVRKKDVHLYKLGNSNAKQTIKKRVCSTYVRNYYGNFFANFCFVGCELCSRAVYILWVLTSTISLRFCRIDRSTLSKIGWLIFEFGCQFPSQNMIKFKPFPCQATRRDHSRHSNFEGMDWLWFWTHFGLNIDSEIQISVNLFCWESTYLSYRNAGYKFTSWYSTLS